MSTTTHSDPNSGVGRPDAGADAFRTGVWLIPIFGALALWATFNHQPDPTTEFSAWARFVTTGHSYRTFDWDGKEYKILNSDDILAVIE